MSELNKWKSELEDFLNLHKIPNDETLVLRQAKETEVVFFVTYNKRLNEYYLYKIKNNKSKKIKTGEDPDFKELEA